MKGKVSFILLMLGLFFLGACEVSENDVIKASDEARLEEMFSDIPQRLEELSNEFKSRTCLLPRRTAQLVHFSVQVREQMTEKILLRNRLKGENQLYKVSECNSDCQILKFSALLCRRGYFVYALRKLLI